MAVLPLHPWCEKADDPAAGKKGDKGQARGRERNNMIKCSIKE